MWMANDKIERRKQNANNEQENETVIWFWKKKKNIE